MSTREMTQEVRLHQWMGIMQERQASGLSIKAWCEMKGMSRQQYFYWQRKLREAACRELAIQEESAKGLAPVSWARIESGAPEASVTIEMGDCRIEVTAESDLVLLAQVCRMLKSL